MTPFVTQKVLQISSFVHGQTNSTHETKDRAKQLLSEAEKHISPAQWDEAREKAANQNREAIAGELTLKT